jgi:hypothetical protein
MGLPSLTLNADLAKDWCGILERKGLTVFRDEIEEERQADETPSKRVSEASWRVGDGTTELQVLEAIFRDRDAGDVHLIFMPVQTEQQRQLVLRVQELLVASGATAGLKKGRERQ